MAKNIRFIASGSCSALGNFEHGTIARNVDDALAEHLVKDAMCAEYLKPPAPPAPPAQDPPADPTPAPAKRSRTKPTEPKGA